MHTKGSLENIDTRTMTHYLSLSLTSERCHAMHYCRAYFFEMLRAAEKVHENQFSGAMKKHNLYPSSEIHTRSEEVFNVIVAEVTIRTSACEI